MIAELTDHLWQSTLFALAAALLTLAFRNSRAAVRYGIWLSASLKFLVPFSLLMNAGFHLRPAPHSSPVRAQPVSFAIAQAAQPFHAAAPVAMSAPRAFDWLPIVILVWACGFVSIVAIRFRGWRRIRAAIRSGSAMDIPAPLPVRSTPQLLEPGVVGLFRPVLLMPADIATHLTPAQLQTVIAHEACHVARRDNLTSAMHMVVEALCWFHPLIWWIGARLLAERERACDEVVLSQGHEPDVYAEGIIRICRAYVSSPLPCASGVSGADMKQRIQAILSAHVPASLTLARKTVLAAATAAAIVAPIVIGVIDAPALRAQFRGTSAPRQTDAAFEVASVKPSAPIGPNDRVYLGPPRGGPGSADPRRITWAYASLRSILMAAYNVQTFQIVAPDWIGTSIGTLRYDIEAKVPEGARREQLPAMWQNLLQERFGLVLHHESKEFQVEELTVGRGGPKLKETDLGPNPDPLLPVPGPPRPNPPMNGYGAIVMVQPDGKVQMKVKALTMADFAARLGGATQMPVVDKTGLSGRYDFTLNYTIDLSQFLPPGAPRPQPSAAGDKPEPGPDLASVVQTQLGLKLTRAKASLDVIVVDRAQKVPTPN